MDTVIEEQYLSEICSILLLRDVYYEFRGICVRPRAQGLTVA